MGKFNYSTFIKLKQTAKQSVGIKDNYLWIQLHQEEKDCINESISIIIKNIDTPIIGVLVCQRLVPLLYIRNW